uniref:Pyridoxal phosphate homeostasis protein n=1 Tax=candidate division WOR-3 bacterium TaxID=2052148 RepID=A0A7C6EAK9_UNCW3
MSVITENLKKIEERINSVCIRVNRKPEEIALVAVTKNVSAERIKEAIACGIKIIGENRVQEAKEKYPIIGKSVEWHMVGHLQTNKVKSALEIFSLIQSVDSIHLAEAIQKRAQMLKLKIPILLEVNTSGEPTKYGFDPSQVLKAIESMQTMENLSIEGLMTIGPGLAVENPEASRRSFQMLQQLKNKIEIEFKIKLRYLSMGMSSDFEIAIEEGSNMIRIGTAIFGERPQ